MLDLIRALPNLLMVLAMLVIGLVEFLLIRTVPRVIRCTRRWWHNTITWKCFRLEKENTYLRKRIREVKKNGRV